MTSDKMPTGTTGGTPQVLLAHHLKQLKLPTVLREYETLRSVGAAALRETEVAALVADLRRVNAELWEIEDDIRAEEARARFGSAFVALARAVYHKNDERAAIKRRINQALESELIEEKSYWTAGRA